MARAKEPERFESKLEDMRGRLLGDDVSVEELGRMRMQMDMLERTLTDELDFHHHHTNEHHDDVTLTEDPAFEKAQERVRRNRPGG